ncbi:MAG TPA: DNA recombination protein RmuC [Terriglobales bacterium]|nr:DNA recombination protein RmuC [Terriglobales bacterium]
MVLELLIAGAVGGALGSVLAGFALRARAAALQSQLFLAERDLASARSQLATLQEANAQLREAAAGLVTRLELEKQADAEKLQLVERATDELRHAFQALAADALRSNNQSFLELAKENLEKFQSQAKGDLEARQKEVETLVAPIADSLAKVDTQIQQMEKERAGAYAKLAEQVHSLVTTQKELQIETGNLVKALRAPSVRGRWGEIQLRRVVEIAGMAAYCDFEEQVTVTSAQGRMRPDLIVKLPGGKNVVVDAKTPLHAYLEAVESADDEVRRAKLADHARQVREQMRSLGSKAYWEQFEPAPEFVVMFLPGETFFSAALEQDPGLIEQGVLERVIPASPTTLIALLKAVAYGWNQEKLARNAQRISVLGRELYERLRSLGTHMDALRRSLDRAVESYNKAAGSLESRVMVSARRFPELGAAVSEEIPPLDQIETTTHTLSLDWGEETTAELPLGQGSESEKD